MKGLKDKYNPLKDKRVKKIIAVFALSVIVYQSFNSVLWSNMSTESDDLAVKLSAAEKEVAIAKGADSSIRSLKKDIQELSNGEHHDKIQQLNTELDVPTILEVLEKSSQLSLLNINSYAFSGNASIAKGQLKTGDNGVVDDTAKANMEMQAEEQEDSENKDSKDTKDKEKDKDAVKDDTTYYVLEVSMGCDSDYSALCKFTSSLEKAGYYFTVKECSASTGANGGALSGKIVVDFYSLVPPKYGDVEMKSKEETKEVQESKNVSETEKLK